METPPPARPEAALALAAAVLGPLAALLAALWLRLAPVESAHAWPWPAIAPPWLPLPAALIALTAALICAVLSWRRQAEPAFRAALVTCLLWPALPLGLAWLLVPAAGPPTPATLAAAVLVLAAAGWIVWRGGGRTAPRRGQRPGRLRAVWIGLHGLAVVALVALGLWGNGFASPRALALSLLLYPVYALVQLFLVLAVAWPHLHRLAGGRTGAAVFAVALVFALVHWPNPVLMLLSGAGMLLWATAYARGRTLVALAASMGLLATLVAQGLPDAWTQHLRAGPRYVRERTVPPVAAAAARQAAPLPAGEARVSGYLAALYPGVVGRSASPGELARWWRSVAACRRGVLAWHFYISDEYWRKFGAPAGQERLDGERHWTRLPAPWPERIGAYARAQPGRPATAWEDFLRRLYREVLQREASPAELATWSRDLSVVQHQRLLRFLLAERHRLADAPFDTCRCEELLLHH